MTLPERRDRSSGWPELFELIRKTEPIADAYDVEWWGPYFIPKPREWHRSRFMLYGGSLYGSLEIEWTTYISGWDIDSGSVSYQGGPNITTGWRPEEIWASALLQLTRRMNSALSNPTAYNERVRRLIPLAARTGRVTRKWTWARNARPLLSRKELGDLERVCGRCEHAAPWRSLSSSEYLQLVGCMYDTAFPELAGLSPREKHASKADSRHGGLLDLPDNDAQAFRIWFESRAWTGCHPWEIVFGHPHGILFSPWLSDEGTWRFHLSVESPGLYLLAVKMALALGETGAPFVLHDKSSVTGALRGTDDVEIGPSYGLLSLASLREIRPAAVGRVRWDPVPEIQPITSAQRERVDYVLHMGSPAGREAPISPDSRTSRRVSSHGRRAGG